MELGSVVAPRSAACYSLPPLSPSAAASSGPGLEQGWGSAWADLPWAPHPAWVASGWHHERLKSTLDMVLCKQQHISNLNVYLNNYGFYSSYLF